MFHDIIAYAFDADHHCVDCTRERFPNGTGEDSEGNEIHPIFVWDSWWSGVPGPEILTCGDCHEVIDVCKPDDGWVTRVVDGYVECALWADTPTDEDGERPETELSDEGRDDLRSDVTDFLSDDETLTLLVGLDPGQVGHDYWLTRNGHGAGFWDRGLGKRGDRLTEITKPYGSRDLYLGDDGLIYVS